MLTYFRDIDGVTAPCEVLTNSIEAVVSPGMVIPIRSNGLVNPQHSVLYDDPLIGNVLWVDERTLSILRSDTIWMDSDEVIPPLFTNNFAELNERRELLSAKLETIDEYVITPDPAAIEQFFAGPDVEWTYQLQDAVSVLFPYAASGYIAPFAAVYRAGELVYASFIDCVEWLLQKASSWLATLRDLSSLILSQLRSRKGLSDIASLFVSERPWFLHHTAHPPAGFLTAVEGRFAAAMRRACFRPLPA